MTPPDADIADTPLEAYGEGYDPLAVHGEHEGELDDQLTALCLALDERPDDYEAPRPYDGAVHGDLGELIETLNGPAPDADRDTAIALKEMQRKLGHEIANEGKVSEKTRAELALDPVESVRMIRALVVYNMTVYWKRREIPLIIDRLIDAVHGMDPMAAAELEAYPTRLNLLMDSPGIDDVGLAMQNLASEFSHVSPEVFTHLRYLNDGARAEADSLNRTIIYEGMDSLCTLLARTNKADERRDIRLQLEAMRDALVESQKDDPSNDVRVIIAQIEHTIDESNSALARAKERRAKKAASKKYQTD